jgi:hypothetical protein
MADASAIVSDMERRAKRHGPLPEPNLADVDTAVAAPSRVPYRDPFSSVLYRRRILFRFLMWFIGYITVYAYAAGFPGVLSSLGYPPPSPRSRNANTREGDIGADTGCVTDPACGDVFAVLVVTPAFVPGHTVGARSWMTRVLRADSVATTWPPARST